MSRGESEEVTELRKRSEALEEMMDFLVENFGPELLELIGREKCIAHFNIKEDPREEW